MSLALAKSLITAVAAIWRAYRRASADLGHATRDRLSRWARRSEG